jgi:heme exporter protein A
VDLELDAGTVTGLMGPNGAGKSTLLGILSTLMAPSRGEIALGRHVIRDGRAPSALRARIGYLGHTSGLYDDLSALENLAFFARLAGVGEDAVESRAAQALRSVGLERFGDRRVKHYSRGMVQRLALGRLIVVGPRLWLLDEPTTGLDESSVEALERLLQDRKEAEDIVLVVSHDAPFLARVSDRIVQLANGRIVSETRP